MESVRFIEYKSQEILLVDFTQAKTDEEVLAIIKRSNRLAMTRPANSILALTDVSLVHFNDRVLTAVKEGAKKNTLYFKASATVGVTGLKKVVLPMIARFSGRNIKPFDDREQAMDWLLTQI